MTLTRLLGQDNTGKGKLSTMPSANKCGRHTSRVPSPNLNSLVTDPGGMFPSHDLYFGL